MAMSCRRRRHGIGCRKTSFADGDQSVLLVEIPGAADAAQISAERAAARR
jgi:hypothetical protein